MVRGYSEAVVGERNTRVTLFIVPLGPRRRVLSVD